MSLFAKITTYFLIFIITNIKAEVNIKSYKHFIWPRPWSDAFYEEIKKDSYQKFLDRYIDEENLSNLDCPDYNYATDEEKKDFWLVFFSSLARAESGLNEEAKSPRMRGHRSYGLLQLAPATAEKFCNLVSITYELMDGAENLKCGLTLMDWQLSGAPERRRDGTIKLKRPDLENQLFGTGILLWGPLRSHDKRGRKLIYSWFNDHLEQLPFCKILE